ncbi:MAG: hypothetical protein JXR70_05555 [Spirochaetales bacterium]|nr:hypothetical protein [Spirochaetales bacterium]
MKIRTKRLDYFDVERNLQQAIDDGKVIRVISYAMSTDVENTLDKIVERLLIKYNKPELKSLVYTCTKELAINGTKANIKRIFFEENKLNIHNEADYEKGISLYKKMMKEEITLQYGKKAKLKGFFVKISFTHTEDVLKIEVMNNSCITEQEQNRLRTKLAKTMQYDDLMQYYMENADDTEGSGMGLALIIILLKGEGLDPNLFRIAVKNNLTTARIEIPISDDYRSERDRKFDAMKRLQDLDKPFDPFE